MKKKLYVIHTPPKGDHKNECAFCKDKGFEVDAMFIGNTGLAICTDCIEECNIVIKDDEAA